MKKIIFLITLIFVFILNYILYISSEDYRFFLKKIKYGDKIVSITETPLDDKIFEKQDIDELKIDYDLITDENKPEENTPLNTNKPEENITENTPEIAKIISTELNENQKIFLEKFSTFGLQENTNSSKIMGVSEEYPSPFREYIGKGLKITLFFDKQYIDIKKIFDILAYDEGFLTNQTNSFADMLFYINMNEKDGFVRLVLKKGDEVYGLQIKKEEYTNIKTILKQL